MNKKQLMSLGLIILSLSIIVLASPKYIYIPRSGYLLKSQFPDLANTYEDRIGWDWILRYSLPIILLGGFALYLMKDGVWEKTLGSVRNTFGPGINENKLKEAINHGFLWKSYFFIFIMLIEPKTTPLRPKGKVIFGVAVAALIFILTQLGVRFDVELSSLLALNLFVPLLNKIV